MSNRPQGLGSFLPTGGSLPGAFALYQQYLPKSSTLSPKEYAVVVPARQAYSHSASEGRRMFSLFASLLSWRNSCVTLRQKSVAWCQSTISTELRGPFHLEGLCPMTTK